MNTITMSDSPVTTITQVKSFLQLDNSFRFEVTNKYQKYRWVEQVIIRFRYHHLRKKRDKTLVRRYIQRVTGLSSAQLTVLIARHKDMGRLIPYYAKSKRNGFSRKYYPYDIKLLIETDYLHNHLSGEATKRILKREYEIYGKKDYGTISDISASHLYNIRNHNRQYNTSKAKYFSNTRSTRINIGVRAKPQPNGKPGFLRVDTVHQGDRNGIKGVYHLNIVDEVTQWEMIATVPAISEHFLTPVIKELLHCFPFVIHEFHADNGSEFINRVVAKLLTKLYIKLTKSRARYSNDNALVESKNGSIIRKLYGRNHIPAKYAERIDRFNRKYVNLYLNYHRPCGFSTDVIDKRGKIKKKYDTWMIPYEKFISLDNPEQYLAQGVSMNDLKSIAYEMSDNQFAEEMRKAKKETFRNIKI